MNPVLRKPYEIRDDFLAIPNVPDGGLEWNKIVVATNLVDV